MADESNSQINRIAARAFSDLESASKTLSKAADNLSAVGSDKLLNTLKQELKNRELLTEAQADSIKDMRKLDEMLSALTKQYKAVIKINEEYEEQVKRLTKLENYEAEAAKSIAKQIRDRKLKELDLTEEHTEALKKGIPTFNAYIVSIEKQIARHDELHKGIEKVTGVVSKNVKHFLTLAGTIELTKRALKSNYQQLHTLGNKGLLGAYAQINLGAVKLYTTADKFAAMVNDNRDIVNMLGGGTGGISKFGDIISEAQEDLTFLGAASSDAAAKFVQLSKKSGLTPNSPGFVQNMRATSKQFKLFNGLFGDTYEDYANLMDSLQNEEQTRNKLNSLNDMQRLAAMDELRERTQNAKLLGLSNDQIVEFNKRIGEIFNPEEAGQIGKRATEAMMMQASVTMMAQQLAGGGAQDQATLAQLTANQTGISKLMGMHQRRASVDEVRNYLATNEGANAMAAIQNARARTNLGDQFTTETRNQLFAGGGGWNEFLKNYGIAQATADVTGKRITGKKTPEEVEEIMNAARNVNGSGSLADKGLTLAAKTVERLTWVIENPLAQAISALASAVSVLAIATLGKSAVGLLGKAGGLLGGGAAGSAGGMAARMFGLGALGTSAVAAGGLTALLWPSSTGETTSLESKMYNRSLGGANASGQFGAPKKLDPRMSNYSDLISKYAQQYGVDANVMAALFNQESGGNPRAISSAGAKGLGQLMDPTAKDLGITDPFNPESNIEGSTRYMAQLLARYNGDYSKALAAYNGGMGNVDKAVKAGGANWLSNMPRTETRNYVPAILNNLSPGALVPNISGSAGPAAAAATAGNDDAMWAKNNNLLESNNALLAQLVGKPGPLMWPMLTPQTAMNGQ